jgi:hypothetical protein
VISLFCVHSAIKLRIIFRVEPEGYRVHRNVPLIFDLNPNTRNSLTTQSPPSSKSELSAADTTTLPTETGSSQFKKTVEMKWPSDVVDGSRRATVEVIGENSETTILSFFYDDRLIQVTLWGQY